MSRRLGEELPGETNDQGKLLAVSTARDKQVSAGAWAVHETGQKEA